MIRFNAIGGIEVCVDSDRFVPIPTDDELLLDSLTIPVHVRVYDSKVVVTMRAHGVTLHTTLRIDRYTRTVNESPGCLASSLREWSLHFIEFVGQRP